MVLREPQRYLVDPRNFKTVRVEADFLVVGSGIAGLWVAYHLSKSHAVCIITKSSLSESSTWYAQGGIAAAIMSPDSPEAHLKDTIEVGQGLCDEEAVRFLVSMAPKAVQDLINAGVKFDRQEGGIAFGLEGGHSFPRILHARGDSTGAEIENALISRVRAMSCIEIRDQHLAIDVVLSKQGRVAGLNCLDERTGELVFYPAKAVLLATGGLGQMYLRTTNPPVATGDGVAMAYRAGAEVCDMEFEQFHPTTFTTKDGSAFLITEALRGEGAYLLDSKGRRFVAQAHPLGELAPRDVIVRRMAEVMRETGESHFYLDARHLPADHLKARFPNVVSVLKKNGYSLSSDLIPIAPAMHYMIGGVKTNTRGETNIPGLYCSGESAATWVHGANRLASNSLLEGIVFGYGVVSSASEYLSDVLEAKPYIGDVVDLKSCEDVDFSGLLQALRQAMESKAGLIRNQRSADELVQEVGEMDSLAFSVPSRSSIETKNMLMLAALIGTAIGLRKESRGVHFREDYPDRDDVRWRKHILFTKKGVSFA